MTSYFHVAMASKMKKRVERLVTCVKFNDIQRLEHFVKRKKYIKMQLDEIGVNKRRETLLHLACRLRKYEIVKFLLNNSIGDPTSMDYKGNTPLHVALKAVMKIDERNQFIAGNLTIPTFKLVNCKMLYFSLQENDTCKS